MSLRSACSRGNPYRFARIGALISSMATGQTMVSSSTSARERRWLLLLAVAVVLCSGYANLSFLVENPADYRFFPPFRAGVNARPARTAPQCAQSSESSPADRATDSLLGSR